MSESVELLTWSGCPSSDEAHDRLVTVLKELGRPDVEVQVRWIETEEEAGTVHFIGSPTFRFRGRDLLPAQGPAPIGLSCRVYRRRDGRVSPLPDPEELRDALGRALAQA